MKMMCIEGKFLQNAKCAMPHKHPSFATPEINLFAFLEIRIYYSR